MSSQAARGHKQQSGAVSLPGKGSGNILMVNGKVGFTMEYIADHIHRAFRGAISLAAEAENIALRFERRQMQPLSDFRIRQALQKAVFIMLRLKDLDSGVEPLPLGGYQFNIMKPVESILYMNAKDRRGREIVDHHFLIFSG